MALGWRSFPRPGCTMAGAFAPLAGFPMGLFLMQPAECCRFSLLCSVTEAPNSTSVQYFWQLHFEKLILKGEGGCSAGFLRSRFCLSPPVRSGLCIHRRIHTGGVLCHRLYLTDRYLVRPIAGICGKRRGLPPEVVISVVFVTAVEMWEAVACRISPAPSNLPSLQMAFWRR